MQAVPTGTASYKLVAIHKTNGLKVNEGGTTKNYLFGAGAAVIDN
jgi:hypothetical protein